MVVLLNQGCCRKDAFSFSCQHNLHLIINVYLFLPHSATRCQWHLSFNTGIYVFVLCTVTVCYVCNIVAVSLTTIHLCQVQMTYYSFYGFRVKLLDWFNNGNVCFPCSRLSSNSVIMPFVFPVYASIFLSRKWERQYLVYSFVQINLWWSDAIKKKRLPLSIYVSICSFREGLICNIYCL